METWSDSRVRVVSLNVLEAMCKHISGHCHRFEVSRVGKTRVRVEYSNPDEWGFEHPMTAEFPCYGAEGHVSVVLEYKRILHDSHDGEGWQNFEQLRDCPTINPNTGEECQLRVSA